MKPQDTKPTFVKHPIMSNSKLEYFICKILYFYRTIRYDPANLLITQRPPDRVYKSIWYRGKKPSVVQKNTLGKTFRKNLKNCPLSLDRLRHIFDNESQTLLKPI